MRYAVISYILDPVTLSESSSVLAYFATAAEADDHAITYITASTISNEVCYVALLQKKTQKRDVSLVKV